MCACQGSGPKWNKAKNSYNCVASQIATGKQIVACNAHKYSVATVALLRRVSLFFPLNLVLSRATLHKCYTLRTGFSNFLFFSLLMLHRNSLCTQSDMSTSLNLALTPLRIFSYMKANRSVRIFCMLIQKYLSPRQGVSYLLSDMSIGNAWI